VPRQRNGRLLRRRSKQRKSLGLEFYGMPVALRKKGAISPVLLKDCAILDTKTGKT
jgi:hypothetical protein